MEANNPFAGIRTCESYSRLLILFFGSLAGSVLLALLLLALFRWVLRVPVGTFEITAFVQGIVYAAVCWGLLSGLGVDHRAVLRDWRSRLRGDLLTAVKYFGVYCLFLGALVGAAMLLLHYERAQMTSFMARVAPDGRQYSEAAGIMAASGTRFAFLALSILVLAPIGEELFYRRILYVFLRQRMSFARALLVSSALFAAAHATAALFVFPVGLLLGWAYEKERRLPVNIVLHALINIFVMYARLS
jgi:membrane protease YdiL (CAAX protease family)